MSRPDRITQPPFVPMSAGELRALGWEELDVLLITGDAYVDHPSFGSVLLARWLIGHGFRTGLVAQPGWEKPDDLRVMGRPRLFAGVSAGALDSLLAHYTAFRKKRHDDAYTPGGKAGARPNRACLVYANLARRAFPGLPLVLGGIEASLRRVSHYDFWTDSLRRPLLMDAKADLLIWGMGERATLECAQRLDARPGDAAALRGIPGTAWMDSLTAVTDDAIDAKAAPHKASDAAPAVGVDLPARPAHMPAHLPEDMRDAPHVALPGHEAILAAPEELLRLTRILEKQVHRLDAWAFQPVGGRAVVLARPAPPLTTAEMDALYEMPFTRRPHPSYSLPIPAAEMMRFSITSHRGCGGGCSFCSLALHQGRRISSRSEDSILAEAVRLGRENMARGKGPVAISDVGGPTANMWRGYCALDREQDREQDRARAASRTTAAQAGARPTCPQSTAARNSGPDAAQGLIPDAAAAADAVPTGSRCRRVSCCYPTVCKFFVTPQRDHVALLRRMAALPEVKQARIASGVRADLALRDAAALAAYTGEFTGGQLKLAPEHCAPTVLRHMRKPPLSVFTAFHESFVRQSRAAGREQYVVPYLMSAFPGCTDDDMRAMGGWLRERRWNPRQTQCFIPTPGTVATAMFYCGRDERGEAITVARTDAERLRQHGILMPDAGPDPRGRRGRTEPERERGKTRKDSGRGPDRNSRPQRRDRRNGRKETA